MYSESPSDTENLFTAYQLITFLYQHFSSLNEIMDLGKSYEPSLKSFNVFINWIIQFIVKLIIYKINVC